MKKNVTIAALTVLGLFLPGAVKETQGQPLMHEMPTYAGNKPAEKEMKGGTTTPDVMAGLQTEYPVIFRKLTKEYSTVNNLTYRKSGRYVFLGFTSNNSPVSSVYSLRGKLRYEVMQMGRNIPVTVAGLIKKEYPAYRIFHGRYIRTKDETLYQVVVENNSMYRVLLVANDEITEVSSVIK